MTTSIAPSNGAGALFTQQGTGTTPGYAALDDRRSNSGSLQEGVYGTPTTVTAGGVAGVANADFMVTQRGAGANMSVDVNMPGGGFAYVQGDTITGQGLYVVPVHSANINEAIAAADPTNPRIDQVILEVQDNVLDASGGNLARTRVVSGTATAGATLANRSGAAALPGSALLLADVLVPAVASSIPNSGIRDRRKWARGAYNHIQRNNGAAYTTTSSAAAVDATNLQPRVECSGAPLRIGFRGHGQHSIVDAQWSLYLRVDGVQITDQEYRILSRGAFAAAFDLSWVTTPAAGSHQLGPYFGFGSAGGTVTISSVTGQAVEMTVEEIPRQNAANSNGVTTG